MTGNSWSRGDVSRGDDIQLMVDGEAVKACRGETVATAMLAAGAAFDTDAGGAARAPLCNMGTCFECVAVVDGRPLTRTCLTRAADGMTVETSRRL